MSLEARHRSWISGQARGLGPAAARAGLTVLSWGYGLAIRLRNVAYETALVRAYRPARPSIVVGNVTAGGTGKTPFVHWLVGEVSRRGLRPAVLSRGYRSAPALGDRNDEVRLLERAYPGVAHVEGADRLESARRAANAGADVLVYADALQHRRLLAHMAIGLVDATCPFGYGRLLPRGLLREPLGHALERIDLAVITRSDQVDANELDAIRRRLERVSSGLPTALAVHAPVSVEIEDARPGGASGSRGEPGGAAVLAAGRESMRVETRVEEPGVLAGRRVHLFSGIANPAAFEATVRGLGGRVTGLEALPDHVPHEEADVLAARRRAAASGAELLLTTRKDRVRMLGDPARSDRVGPEEVPLAVLDVSMRIVEGEEMLSESLDRVLPPLPRVSGPGEGEDEPRRGTSAT